jgi:hypothetical protein
MESASNSLIPLQYTEYKKGLLFQEGNERYKQSLVLAMCMPVMSNACLTNYWKGTVVFLNSETVLAIPVLSFFRKH